MTSDELNGFLIINDNEVFYLKTEEVRLGRSPANDMMIVDLRVSRTHARINYSEGRYVLVDLNSSGGTTINGRPISQKTLDDGDVIALANGGQLVFGQDPARLPADAKNYIPPESDLAGKMQTGMLSWPTEPNLTAELNPDEDE